MKIQQYEIGTEIEYRKSRKYRDNDFVDPEWRRGTLVYQSKENLILDVEDSEIVLYIPHYEIQEYVSPETKLAEMVEWALRESKYAQELPGRVCQGLGRDIARNLISGYDLKV